MFEGRFAVHVDGGYQANSNAFQQTVTQRVYGENARVTAVHAVSKGAFGDVGGFFQVWEQLQVGLTYSHFSKSGKTMVTATVPHPILFGSNRSVSFEARTLPHRERATHIHVSWHLDVPSVEELDVTVYGGPSVFYASQGVVSGVVISEPSGPPFSSVRIDRLIKDEHTRNGFGGHVGVDVTYMWTTYVGLGGFARFAAASIKSPSPGGEFSMRVGGFQSGGGLRLRF